MKAISPLIATVLLISFTFTLAAIVAGWGQNVVTQSQAKPEKIQQEFKECGGGTLQFVSTGQQNPTIRVNQIVAQIQVDGAALSNFTFVLTLNNQSTIYLSDITNSSIAPGARNIGTIISEQTTLTKDNITSVMVTSPCKDARTVQRALE